MKTVLNWKSEPDSSFDPLEGLREPVCEFCGSIIEESPVIFRDFVFHPDCFVGWWLE